MLLVTTILHIHWFIRILLYCTDGALYIFMDGYTNFIQTPIATADSGFVLNTKFRY